MRKKGSSKRLLALAAVAASWVSTGCYYAHLAEGQLRLMASREPIEEVLENAETPASLRERLELVNAARSAADSLGLDVGQRYTSYVDWPGDRIVTTVVATLPGEVRPADFHFPIVGSVPYKGFFSQERAEQEAATLRAKGLDVCLLAIPAYSTLGWMADPVTTPMLAGDPGSIFATVVHELVHATVFIASRPDFNEGVASFVGRQAALDYFEALDPTEAERVRRRFEDDRLLSATLLALRDRVEALYALPLDVGQRRERRERLSAEAREEIATLGLHRRDAPTLAQRIRLNDACLAIRGTYAADAARHAALLARLDGDLERFVTRLREAADQQEPEEWFFAPASDDERGR